MSENKGRQEFLRERYGLLWSNVDRSMRGIWNIRGTTTVAGTILVVVDQGYLDFSIGASLAFLVILWALNMTSGGNGGRQA